MPRRGCASHNRGIGSGSRRRPCCLTRAQSLTWDTAVAASCCSEEESRGGLHAIWRGLEGVWRCSGSSSAM
eukprot:6382367-Pyramimonas_sp.AAC.1